MKIRQYSVSILMTLMLGAAVAAPSSAKLLPDGHLRIEKITSPKINGELFGCWKDNSTWADVRVNYAVGHMNNSALPYQSVEVFDIKNGYAQLQMPLPATLRPGEYELKFSARMSGRSKLNIGVRTVNPPYVWDCRQQVMPGGNWEKITVPLTIGTGGTLPKAIYFQLNSPCLLNLTRPELFPSVGGDAVHADRNLFRSFHLDRGLPAAWSWHNCFSSGDHVNFVPGRQGLKIEVQSGVMTSYDYRDSIILYSAPMSPAPLNRDLVCAFRAKGRAKGTLIIRSGSDKIAEQPFSLDSDDFGWIETGFRARSNHQNITALLEFKGTMVLAGAFAGIPELKEGAASLPGLLLIPGKGDAAESGVYFTDEDPAIEVAARNCPPGSQVRIVMTDLYGKSRTQTVPAAESSVIRLRNGIFPGKGALRIEATPIAVDGSEAGPTVERVVHLLDRPRFWGKDAPDSPFGVHVQPVNTHLRMAKAIGANFARLHDAGVQLLGWAYLEREPGKWTFDDAGLKRYRQHHLLLVGELTTAPSFASGAVKSTVPPPPLRNSVTAPYFLPESISGYRKYCDLILQRYGNQLFAIDVWNEPWLPLFYHTDFVRKLPPGTKRWASFGGGFYISPDDPAAGFLEMQKAAWLAVKESKHNLLLLGINTTDSLGSEGRVPGNEFSQRMKALGAEKFADRIVYHQYNTRPAGYPGDEVEKGYARAIGPFVGPDGRASRPVWFSEGSPSERPVDNYYRHTIRNGAASAEIFEEADRIVRFVCALLGQKVEKIFLYSMALHNGYGSLNPHRLLITAAGELHPSAGGYSAFARLIEGRSFLRRESVADGVYAYLFTGDGETVAVLLADPGRRAPALPLPEKPGLARLDLFGNPTDQVGMYATYLAGKFTPEELLNYLRNLK